MKLKKTTAEEDEVSSEVELCDNKLLQKWKQKSLGKK